MGRKPETTELAIKLQQLADASMVGPKPNVPYTPAQKLAWEGISREAQGALKVYLDLGYEIPTPYRVGSAYYGAWPR